MPLPGLAENLLMQHFPCSYSDDLKAYVMMEGARDPESHSVGELSANLEPQFGFNVNEKHTYYV